MALVATLEADTVVVAQHVLRALRDGLLLAGRQGGVESTTIRRFGNQLVASHTTTIIILTGSDVLD